MSRFESLGTTKEVRLPQGVIRYRERGTGDVLVFVHGLLVNGDLWRNVVPRLSTGYRCITPDLPLGSHEVAMNAEADLSPLGVAKLLADFLEALDLRGVTLVANDTGGALAQLVVAHHPGRVTRLVLTPSDCFDIFPPKLFSYLRLVVRVPGAMWLLGQSARLGFVRRLPIAFGWLAKRPIEERAARSYGEPGLRSAAVRRDTAKFCKTVDPRYTQEAVALLERFEGPVLLAWAREDRLFPHAYAERLARVFPDARLVAIDDSYTFVPEDRPDELAGVIGEFLESTRANASRPDAADAAARSGFRAA